MTREKPSKPHEDYPLYAHSNGQWAKKIRGKTVFFGQWSKWREALERYEATKDTAGIPETFDLMDLVELFLDAKQKQVESGELKPDTWKEYDRVCAKMLAILGSQTPVDSLNAGHFIYLREELAKTITHPVTLKNTVVKLRVLFAWAYEAEHCDKPLRYRAALKRPPKRLLREARNNASAKLFSREELKLMLDGASGWMKPAIYLGINCGLGNRDLCELPWSAIGGRWLDFPRIKNQIARRCYLWPETVQALESWRREQGECEWVVTGRSGQQLGQGESASTPVAHRLGGLLESLKIQSDRRGFYTLRHTYRTIADATKDQVAVRYTMGHADHSIDDSYREAIDDSRLIAVAAHVRSWLLSCSDG